MKVEYQEAQLSAVLDYYAKDFKLPDGRELFTYEAFVDTAKGKVIFRLALKETSE